MSLYTTQATSLPIKLRLIPIFQHMHHDAATAAQVRQREGDDRDINIYLTRISILRGITMLMRIPTLTREINIELQVRAACLSMLPSYPGQSFLLTTLRTLTSLATHTLVDVPDQVCSEYDQRNMVTGQRPTQAKQTT